MKKILVLLLFFFLKASLYAQPNTFTQIGYVKGSSNDVAIKAMVKYGNYLYVASNFSSSYLKTYNVANPFNIVLTDSQYYASTDRSFSNLSIDQNRLYAIGGKGLTVYDLTNPAHPSQIAFIIKVTSGGTDYPLKSGDGVKSGNIYLCESGWTGLMAINISNLSSPIYYDYIGYSGNLGCIKLLTSSTALFIDGYDAYFLDFSNTANLTKTTTTITGDPASICLNTSKNVAYISSVSSWSDYGRIYVVDLNSQQVISNVDVTSYAIEVGDMSLKNDDTLLVGTDDGLLVIDAKNSSNLQVVEYFNTPYYGGARDAIICDGSYFYAASYKDICAYKWGKSPVSIDQFNQNEISVYPNPTNNRISINTNPGFWYDISIFDGVGNVMVDLKNIEGATSLDLSLFSSGVYFIRMTAANFSKIEKIIKY